VSIFEKSLLARRCFTQSSLRLSLKRRQINFLDLTTLLCSSGTLNDKQRELLELQALTKRRIKSARANFADGIKAAKETKHDLEWAQKRVR
jgi:hypothetical protein